MKNLPIILTVSVLLSAGCSFLDNDRPQGAIDEDMLKTEEYAEELVVAAYAVFISAEDINSSFSLWNYDVRSDDAYKGGNGTEDGDVFHALEISTGIMTTAWNINDIWQRLYNSISRVNMALEVLDRLDGETWPLKEQRIAEMRFLRGHAHFLLKQLFKNIVLVTDENLQEEDYALLSNVEYTNDESWQKIADDFKFAYDNLPAVQEDKGRPAKAAAAAYLAKTCLYKAYRQDNPGSHAVTSINEDDLLNVVKYTERHEMSGYDLEDDFADNFRPETENGPESVWAMQYSMNDGTRHGNCNWSWGLIVPNIPGVTDGGCDFYKPSQNLVNAFRTGTDGLPYLDGFNDSDYDKSRDTADPRLFLTVGMPGFPYEFNRRYMMAETSVWSRSNGLYGYYVSLKHNVDPDGGYLVKGSWWGSPMNHIVLRYADVLLFRAEALAQLGRTEEAVDIVNSLRIRAGRSLAMISDYEALYGVRFNVKTYGGSYSKEEALRIVKFERRLEMAMESDRFFDLVRWGEAQQVLTKYYAEEAGDCTIYSSASFTADKNEYLPIPFSQISASAGRYKQNIGSWN